MFSVRFLSIPILNIFLPFLVITGDKSLLRPVSFYENLWQICLMDDTLKEIRNELLSLHKTLMDIERANYEAAFGKITNMQLLNLLFEHQNFVWLREISSLVAEIDELFAAKEGVDFDLRNQLIGKSQSLFGESEANKDFKTKYQANLDSESLVGEHHQRLFILFEKEKA